MSKQKLEYVYKRDGKIVPYDESKIRKAVESAVLQVYPAMEKQTLNRLLNLIVLETTTSISNTVNDPTTDKVTVDDINDIVENVLKSNLDWFSIYQAFSQYRSERERARLSSTSLMKQIKKLGEQTDRDNANVGNNFSAKMLRIGSEANKVCNLANISTLSSKLHKDCDGHIHDVDSYNLTVNCLHIPTAKLLKEGFNSGYGRTNSPKSITTAAELTCIMLQISQNDMFGGQAHPNFDADLAPYLNKSRVNIIKDEYLKAIILPKLDKTTIDKLKQYYNGSNHTKYLEHLDEIILDHFDEFAEETDLSREDCQCLITRVFLIKFICNIASLAPYAFYDEYNAVDKEIANKYLNILEEYVYNTSELSNIFSKGDFNGVLVGVIDSMINYFDKVVKFNNHSTVLNRYKEVFGEDSNKVALNIFGTETGDNIVRVLLDRLRQVFSNRGYLAYILEAIDNRLQQDLHQAMQSVVYNLNTMHSRAGSQVPFSSVNIGIPTSSIPYVRNDTMAVCKAFLEEYDKGLGNGEQPIFPNIIYRVKRGVNLDDTDDYVEVTRFANHVTAHKMNPTYLNLDASKYKPYVDKGVYPSMMGCRTEVLTNVNGESQPIGRGNIAPYTINMVRLGILALRTIPEGDTDKRVEYFFNLLDEQLNNAVYVLKERYNYLRKLKVKDLPFVIGEGLMVGSEDIKDDPEASIEPVLKQGTYAVGFIGLAETLTALLGVHHGESQEAQELGLKIIKHMREFTDKTSQTEGLTFGVYATPAEGLSSRFTTADRKKFGIIYGVTDKVYYTNSYHIPVNYNISTIDKLKLEAPYHHLCNSGHISYMEVDSYPDEKALNNILFKIFKNIPELEYFGVNFHSRQCLSCGTYLEASEIKCPKCGKDHIRGVSRVTGYLSLDEKFGEGKRAERYDRVSHQSGNKGYE